MALSQVEETVARDELFDTLSHLRRRRILTRLRDHDSHDENEFDQRAPGISTESLALELFHYHLLKLTEAGFIYWNRERGVVRRGPRFHEISPLIDLVVEDRDALPAGRPK